MNCPGWQSTIFWHPNFETGDDLILDTGVNGVPNFVHGMCVLGEINIPQDVAPGYTSVIHMGEHNGLARYRWYTFGTVPCDLRTPKSAMQPTIHMKIRSRDDEVVPVGDSNILVNPGSTYYLTLTSDDPNHGPYPQPGDPRNMRFETRPFTK